MRQTAERSKSWAALSVKQDSSRSFLSPDEEKALAAQIKVRAGGTAPVHSAERQLTRLLAPAQELQRIEGIREDLRTAASRSLIKLTEEGSVIDTVLRVRDVEPKLGEFAGSVPRRLTQSPMGRVPRALPWGAQLLTASVMPAGELAKACGVSVPKLQAAIEAGKRAREQLVRRNMPLVAQMATQLAKGKVGFEDVVQARILHVAEQMALRSPDLASALRSPLSGTGRAGAEPQTQQAHFVGSTPPILSRASRRRAPRGCCALPSCLTRCAVRRRPSPHRQTCSAAPRQRTRACTLRL